MNNDLRVFILPEYLADEVERFIKESNNNCLLIPNCIGLNLKNNFLEFLGFTDNKRTLIAFRSEDDFNKMVLKFMLTNFPKVDKTICFTIKGDKNMETQNKLLITIIKAGQGEKLAGILKKHFHQGATIVNARGSGAEYNTFLGMQVDSNKEVVLSIMEAEKIEMAENVIRNSFTKEDGDIVFFVVDVDDFNRLNN